MRMKQLATTVSGMALALAMCITTGTLQGQPMYDRIHVNLPYTVTVGDRTLQPGDYTIQQLRSNGGGSRVLLFYTDSGMKFETSAMTIPVLDPNTARDTKLILDRVGNDYYIDKIWVQGKDYGYEIPMPKSLKERQNEMSQTTVAAVNQPTSTTTEPTTQPSTTAETTPPPVTSQTPAPPAETSTAQNTQATHPTESAQATPPPTPPAATPNESNSADRSAEQSTTPAPARMPNTAANWVMMLLGGGTLSGAGLLLRRKR